MNSLEKIFNEKLTENGDKTYKSTGNDLLDILFMTSYYEKHIEELVRKIWTSDKEKWFARFIRDPRHGLGRRDLGRALMYLANVSPYDVVKSGRFDDLLWIGREEDYLVIVQEARLGNELAKKWMPRLNSKNRDIAKEICKEFNFREEEYREMIKCDTTESKLSSHRTNEIKFEQVPSLAMIKYYDRFKRGEDTKERFEAYLESVKKGEKEIKVSTTTVYDIYKNREKIDADLFFDKLEKIEISCVPILDTSGSMWDSNDSIGKAISIAHYLAKCTTYCRGFVISFSDNPKLIKIKEEEPKINAWGYPVAKFGSESKYCRELNSMYTGEVGSTNFGKVMELLENLHDLPEYLVVLSDMEFDYGSHESKEKLQKLWKEKGYTTKIVWWNFNSRNTTVPEMDEMGNIYLSGYSPMLLKYLEVGFDGEAFLNKLLKEYKKTLTK